MIRLRCLLFVLLFLGIAASDPCTPRSQCLVEFCSIQPDREFEDCWNPDSILIDTCRASTTYGQYYGRGRYNLEFKYAVLELPQAPYDSVVEVPWTMIDTSFPMLREAFQQLENLFGGLWLRKVSPQVADTNHAASKHFELRFDSIIRIDSVINILRSSMQLKELVRAGFMSRPVFTLSVDHRDALDTPRKAVCWSPEKRILLIGGESTDLPVTVVDILGRAVFIGHDSFHESIDNVRFDPRTQVLYVLVNGRFMGRLTTCR
jgi:hypothetical protein